MKRQWQTDGTLRRRVDPGEIKVSLNNLNDSETTSVVRSRAVHPSWLRRLTALVVAVCLFLAPVEAVAVPDVHDGDVPASNHDGGATQVSTDESRPASHSESVPQEGAPESRHAAHVDHCVHGHLLAAAGVRTSLMPTAWQIDKAIGAPALLHESVVLTPRQRPPIL